jgi:AraC-like DNA-binding protein
MNTLREKIKSRGTSDFPFQQYNNQCAFANMTITKTHWHPEYEIIYMLQGKIELKADKQTIFLAAGEIAFIQPGRLHSMKSLTENCSYIAFVFSLDLITLPSTHFFYKELIEPISSGQAQLPLMLAKSDFLYPCVNEALKKVLQCDKKSSLYKQIVFLSVIEIFTALMPRLEPCNFRDRHQNNQNVKEILQFLSEHYAEHFSLNDIAEHVHLHPNYICALFRDYTDHSVFQHLIQLRIEAAEIDLKTTSLSIGEIASRCGFESASFFSKKFKELIGLSPKEYRHQFQNFQ